MIFFIIVIYIIIIAIDWNQLRRINDKLKATIIYFILISTGLFIGILQALDKSFVSPSEIIERIVKYFIK